MLVLCVYLVEATEVRRLLIGVLLQPSGSFTGGLLEHKPTPSEDLKNRERWQLRYRDGKMNNQAESNQ